METLDSSVVIAGYHAAPEAADGLALAHLISQLTDRDLLVARVIPDVPEHPGATRAEQLHVRRLVGESNAAVLAVVPDGSIEVMPVLDPRVAHGLHDLARRQEASLIVLGSSHHSGLGRVLLGGTAEQVVDGAPCPVAVAPPHFHEDPTIAPPVVGVAWDGSPASRAAVVTAAELAGATGYDLLVIHVEPSLAHRPLGGTRTTLEEGVELARRVAAGDVTVEGSQREGDPGAELVDATRSDVGVLVVGSRARGALARVLLGSVSGHVMRGAHAPVLVVPAPA